MIAIFLFVIIILNWINYYFQAWFWNNFNFSQEIILLISRLNIVLTSFLIFLILIRIINSSLRKISDKVLSKSSIWKKLFPMLSKWIFVTLLIIYIFFLLSFLWININTLLAWFWASSLILAIASKEVISNLIWSLSLIFNKSFDIDDTIKVKWFEWKVEEITLSYTKLIDKKGNIIYIPNKNILTSEIENLSKWKEKNIEFNFNWNYTKETILKIKNFLENNSKKLDIKEYKILIWNESDKDWISTLNIGLVFERKKYNEENKKEIFFGIKELF